MKKLVRTLQVVLGAVMAFAIASSASAVMTLNPVAPGASVTVTGAGAKANGPVELLVNDVSRGYVLANGSGNFSFPAQNIVAGDQLYVTASQVWNFNTNGNYEGWVIASGGTNSVSGGVLSVTASSGNITLNLADAATTPSHAIVDTNLTRVFEIRYRVTGSYTYDNGTVIYNPGSGFQFGNSLGLQGGGAWHTNVIDLTVDNFGTANTYSSTGYSVQLAPGGNGFTVGDVLEVDYIRVAEYMDWHFNNAGDNMMWDTTTGTAVVSGGKMALTNATAGSGAQIANQFRPINTAVWNRFETRVQSLTSQAGQIEFFNYFAGGPAYNGGGFQTPFTADGTYQTKVTDLTGSPAFGQAWTGAGTLNVPAAGYTPFFPPLAGETANIDYIRLRPAVTFGPSATVTAGSGVDNWGLY